MRAIPSKLKKEILADPFYKTCARAMVDPNHYCGGRITWEHAIIFAAKQLNEKWAIIPLCEKAHSVGTYQDGGDMNKEINVLIALNRATDFELMQISKVENYKRKRDVLNEKYKFLRHSN